MKIKCSSSVSPCEPHHIPQRWGRRKTGPEKLPEGLQVKRSTSKLLRKNQRQKKGAGDGGFQVQQTAGMESIKLKQPATDRDETPCQQAALARSKLRMQHVTHPEKALWLSGRS